MVDYYCAATSPFAYLGHEAFCEMVRKARVPVALKPIDTVRMFAVSGGVPLKQRAPQRQAYRIVELERWAKYRGLPINPQPKHFPVSNDPGNMWLLAAVESSVEDGLRLLGAIGRAAWVEERDVSDTATLRALAGELGLDVERLAERAAAPDTRARYDALTQEAIDRGMFGVPTYVLDGDTFWGQDRLDFLERALTKDTNRKR